MDKFERRAAQIKNISNDIPLNVTPEINYGTLSDDRTVNAIIDIRYQDFDTIVKSYQGKFVDVKPLVSHSYREILQVIIKSVSYYKYDLNKNQLNYHSLNRYAYQALINLQSLIKLMLNNYLAYLNDTDKQTLEGSDDSKLTHLFKDDIFENNSVEFTVNNCLFCLKHADKGFVDFDFEKVPLIYSDLIAATIL